MQTTQKIFETMFMITKKSIINILSILLLTIAPMHIFACSCIGERSVKEEIKYSDAVLVGTIINSEEIRVSDTLSPLTIIYSTKMKYTLIVEAIYKGKHTKDTTCIITDSGGEALLKNDLELPQRKVGKVEIKNPDIFQFSVMVSRLNRSFHL